MSQQDKEGLLEAFVRGIPAAHSKAGLACADTRERFYRLARACCAQHERLVLNGLTVVGCQQHSWGTRGAMRGWSTCSEVMIVGIAARGSILQVTAPPGEVASILPLLRQRVAVGGVLQLDDTQAYACLPVLSGYVIVPRTTSVALGVHRSEAFWHYARGHLQMFRKIAVRFFPLYLAEACLRFNQRGRDLHALLHEVMNVTSIPELRPLLASDSLAELHRADASSRRVKRSAAAEPVRIRQDHHAFCSELSIPSQRRAS